MRLTEAHRQAYRRPIAQHLEREKSYVRVMEYPNICDVSTDDIEEAMEAIEAYADTVNVQFCINGHCKGIIMIVFGNEPDETIADYTVSPYMTELIEGEQDD